MTVRERRSPRLPPGRGTLEVSVKMLLAGAWPFTTPVLEAFRLLGITRGWEAGNEGGSRRVGWAAPHPQTHPWLSQAPPPEASKRFMRKVKKLRLDKNSTGSRRR